MLTPHARPLIAVTHEWPGDRSTHTKVIDERDVISLHYNTCGDEDTPENGLGIELDALAEGHGTLLVGSRTGMLDDVDMRLAGVGVVLGGRVHGGRVFGGVLRRRGRCRGRRHHVLFVRHDFSFLSLVVKMGLSTNQHLTYKAEDDCWRALQWTERGQAIRSNLFQIRLMW